MKSSSSIILKPVWSKKIIFWLVLSFIVLIIVAITNWHQWIEFSTMLIVIVAVLFQTFLLTLILYSLPYFRIEVTNSYLLGPSPIPLTWNRNEILIEEINFEKISSGFAWLGFYVFTSNNGGKILVWGFDENQFHKLVDVLYSRRKHSK